ncbi:MAG: HD domain-containing protein [Nanoarchaeota archaeon]|nr:HD domain-containing protein [Nanoarchaeota archaeon]
MIEKIAKHYAGMYHKGQFRRNSELPYIVHPENVVNYMKQFGVEDEDSLAIAWLHDTIEDTSLTYNRIKSVFGRNIADGVYLLTRNVDREEYKRRLSFAPENIRMIKLCDTLDNITTLECLSSEGIMRKVDDCKDYYIPMAEELCPWIAKQMKKYISNFIPPRVNNPQLAAVESL